MENIEDNTNASSTVGEVITHLKDESSTHVADSNLCHKSNGVDCSLSSEHISEKVSEISNVIEEPIQGTIYTGNPCETTQTDLPGQNTETSKSDCPNNSVTENKNTEEISISSNIPDINSTVETQNLNEKITTPEASNKDSNTTEQVDSTIDANSSSNENNETLPNPKENDEIENTCVPCEPPEEKINSEEKHFEVSVETCNMDSTTVTNEVHFETEIVVEKNDSDLNENVIDEEYVVTEPESPNHNNILGELGENIELSEVLQSSDVTNSADNNNGSNKVEVFNKEELLDILEGNDVPQSDSSLNDSKSMVDNSRESETEKALKQLSMLKNNRKQRTRMPKNKPKEIVTNVKKMKKVIKDKIVNKNKDVVENNIIESVVPVETVETIEKVESGETIELGETVEIVESTVETTEPAQDKDKNIVNELVMDWDDDEQLETDCKEQLKPVNKSKQDTDQKISVDTSINEDQKQIKSEDEGIPGATRRFGRVIKKKIIFDPDNPDTFTKGKTPIKAKDIQIQKEKEPPIKKIKVETPQEKRKSRSPSSKLQWKKPTPKNNKQHKRLTEVDKLLMDEGAVNMIYQLTPEAPKGKKNVKTKAEFIKKLQSSTPEGKEKKFRERKKEAKYEDLEARKLLGGKHRASLTGSVKSPSVSEDFETHSADDSIIYRRHSSSSYSSSCMSPRRLSDVEVNTQSQKPQIQMEIEVSTVDSQVQSKEANFLSESNSSTPQTPKPEFINKKDCMSLKEKLNTKLSLALNKRKRESLKAEKQVKQKKIINKVETEDTNKTDDDISEFKFISIIIDKHLAEICLKKTGFNNSVEVFSELEQALKYIDKNSDISVTLLSSQCGTLCSSVDIGLLLDENSEVRTKNAYDLAESIRSLQETLSRHSKLLCCGVWGACSGVSAAVVALCDVALASEGATFALTVAGAPTLPGAAAIAAPHRALPQPLVNDLVVFGRRLSASEALQGGLVSRVLWPDRFDDQVRNIVNDIALRPPQATLLKKRLLGLKKSGEAENSFLSSLVTERDLLVEYWTSVEGQEVLRTALDAP